ncbi:hypothetical protein [Desulfovulcanus sp.]
MRKIGSWEDGAGLMKKGLGLIIVFLLFACAPKQEKLFFERGATFAVAGFSQPRHSWEMLAGYIYETKEISPQVLDKLDDFLSQLLSERGHNFVGPKVVRQCEELVIGREHRSNMAAFHYWLKVGQCIPADFILVPFVLKWQEREGGEWGVERPAAVVIDFYLLDVKKEQIRRFHFEEEQLSLSENILDIGKFFKRRARWITALDLAREGLISLCEEMGL